MNKKTLRSLCKPVVLYDLEGNSWNGSKQRATVVKGCFYSQHTVGNTLRAITAPWAVRNRNEREESGEGRAGQLSKS